MLTVTDETFAEAVLASDRPVVVDFWAEWCPPCARIATSLAELGEEFGERVLMAKLNADENPAAARAYGVMSLPSLLVFRGGAVAGTIVGARPKNYLRQALLSYAGLP
jgi:thioredoxin 1